VPCQEMGDGKSLSRRGIGPGLPHPGFPPVGLESLVGIRREVLAGQQASQLQGEPSDDHFWLLQRDTSSAASWLLLACHQLTV
jgi:hypothetical protein